MRAYIVMALAVAGSAAYAQRAGETVAYASVVSYEAAAPNAVSSEVVDFLVTASDARMMDMEEGVLAAQKGSSDKVKEYAATMINDQGMMLGYIKKMAIMRDISLPDDISEEKREGRENLAELSGKKFDKKFVKMMILDHKRDLKLFKEAVNSPDDEVSEFAELYIPVIQSHLKRAKALKRAV